MTTFKFRGASSNTYSYSLSPRTDFGRLPLQSGNYIFASGNAANPNPLFISFTDNIHQDVAENVASGVWDIAQEVYNATLCYFHVDRQKDRRKRQAEQEDLFLYYKSPLN